MGILNRAAKAGLIAATGAVALAGSAQAASAVSICVPATAGLAITSGGSSGTCAAGTPVTLPASAADQQTLINVLPYLTFKSSGIGAKPTITVTGANLQVKRANQYASTDGTGNLIVGDGVQYPVAASHSGSENLIVGADDQWTGAGSAIVGDFHAVSGYANLVAGRQNTVSGHHNEVSGSGNNVAGGYNAVLGGYFRPTVTSDRNTIADGTGDAVHWIKFDRTGAVTGSGTDALHPLTYSWSNGSYGLAAWQGVDISKCAVSVTAVDADDYPGTMTDVAPTYSIYSYGSTSYVYYRIPARATTATSFGYTAKTAADITVDC